MQDAGCKGQKAEGKGQDAGCKRQDAGGRGQEAGGRMQEAGGRRQEAGGRGKRRRTPRFSGDFPAQAGPSLCAIVPLVPLTRRPLS